MLLDGKRVAALIEIDAKEYPQGFVKCSALERLIANVSLEKIRLT